jgi:hypothetical protein
MKLLLPRKNHLLEQAETKADALQQELDIIQKEHGEQGELVQEIQSTKLALVEQQGVQRSQIQLLQKEKEEISKMFAETKEMLEFHNQELKEELKTRSEEIFQLQNSQNYSSQDDDQEALSAINGAPMDLLSSSPIGVVIPSADLVKKPEQKKHVIEWEWNSGQKLAGVYTGWMDLEGNPDGHGTLRIEDGSVFDGEWRMVFRHGKVLNYLENTIDFAMRSSNSLSVTTLSFALRPMKVMVSIPLLMAIYTEGLGERIRITGVVYTCGQTVKFIPETMSTVSAKEKGKPLVSVSIDEYCCFCHHNLTFFSRLTARIETWPHGARYEGEYKQD